MLSINEKFVALNKKQAETVMLAGLVLKRWKSWPI
jgi:hypothetical protein